MWVFIFLMFLVRQMHITIHTSDVTIDLNRDLHCEGLGRHFTHNFVLEFWLIFLSSSHLQQGS